MSSTFSVALSSLQAQSEAIGTAGNNLANVNTVGFKGTSVDFQSALSQSLGGLEVGMGVSTPIGVQSFSQGPLQSSNSPYATAIEGNGFFVLRNADNQQLFTRDGDFTISKDGILQTQTGENVQGWMASAVGINPTGAPGDITLQAGAVLPPQATTKVSVSANLNSETDTSGPTGGTYSVPVTVIDSLGSKHNLTISLTKSSSTPNSWSYQVTIPGADVTAGTPGSPYVIPGASGTLTFNPDGTLDTTSITGPVAITVSGLTNGAANLGINWNLLNPDGTGTITQYAQASSNSPSVDGSEAGALTQLSIENGGLVVATFSNGLTKVEAQIALASIQNPNSLESTGNNNFVTTGKTAAPAFGLPGTGGLGQVVKGQLEGSNVDLAKEFTNLIAFQSGYQASSKVITTADQMTQELLALIH